MASTASKGVEIPLWKLWTFRANLSNQRCAAGGELVGLSSLKNCHRGFHAAIPNSKCYEELTVGGTDSP